MNLTSRKALLIVYLEAVPLVMLMLLVARFVLYVEEIDILERIVSPMAWPLFALAFNRLIMIKNWEKIWIFSVAFVVGAVGASSVFPHDFLRHAVLAMLFWLFFHVLNIDILRLPERISNGSP